MIQQNLRRQKLSSLNFCPQTFNLVLPIVVWLAVEFGVPGVAGVRQGAATHATAEAVLVPRQLAHPHEVAVLYLLAATLAYLDDLLSFDARAELCGNIALVSSMW